MTHSYAENILQSRKFLINEAAASIRSPDAAEGGCGVLGFAANIPVAGRHVLAASRQMHNRGNGKGGGIAMAGLDPAQAWVDPVTLRSHYLLQIALLDPTAQKEVEAQFIQPNFEIAQAYPLEHLDDFREIPGLEIRPPDVCRYFVRLKAEVLEKFAVSRDLASMPRRPLEDEFVYQNSFHLNRQFYASLGEKRAFVLSHGRNLSVLKIVGYAEDVVSYYRLQDQTGYVWISHQRYPTKGKVWHPAGAHPFIGLNEALVHNGDFANYHAVSEYLHQRNIDQLFLTDTEVSVQLFDLWDRVYGYPLEITLEAMAPTSEHDFVMLPPEKQALYQAVQRAHMHGSPDGPWFFILARSLPGNAGQEDRFELLGITDTSMLRPQVFALYENLADAEPGVQIGVIASERQAINACLRSLSEEDERFQPLADRYWMARGGSHTDGGAFRFQVNLAENGDSRLVCENKFLEPVVLPAGRSHVRTKDLGPESAGEGFRRVWVERALRAFHDGGSPLYWRWLEKAMPGLDWDELAWGLGWLDEFASSGDDEWRFALESLNMLRDRVYDCGSKKRASVLTLVDRSLEKLFSAVSLLTENGRKAKIYQARRLTWQTRHSLTGPPAPDKAKNSINELPVLALDGLGFPPEGDQSAARWLVRAYQKGWRQFIAYNWRGGRFAACGLGAGSHNVRMDLYGDVGDYSASGLDGAEVYLHGDGQDQVGQILKDGRLVIYGDVGQTFLYGAKGGEIYVRGSAAGRPLINAAGRPRAVINGTCLDYLAESFMAGDPYQGGGFVVLNGMTFSDSGQVEPLQSPYPGGNLFSLASGGAIYLRDPHRLVQADQLNGGVFTDLSSQDWELIQPYLMENERLFDICLDDLLTVDGQLRSPADVYRKVEVHGGGVLHETENR